MLRPHLGRGESEISPSSRHASRSAFRNRLATFAHDHPEWRPWLLLLEQTLHALDEPVWTAMVPRLHSNRPATAPLLDGVELSVDGRRVRRWVHRLLQTAAKKGEESGRKGEREKKSPTRPLLHSPALPRSRLDALALLEAAAGQDHQRIHTLAEQMGTDSQALAAVAQLAVMPLLQVCGRHLRSQVSSTWSSGYCPVCGAWPTLAELRGLERRCKLRCARCGGEWEAAWLRCPYCGETDHQRLGFLLPEGAEEIRRVATCATCRGYVKTLTTLQGSPPAAVVLEDLATVDLDLVALERGYTRPERPGYAVTIHLTEQPSRLRTVFGRPSTSSG